MVSHPASATVSVKKKLLPVYRMSRFTVRLQTGISFYRIRKAWIAFCPQPV
jgi:hypothetical protein